jgi:hypothetical protein
MLVILMRVLVLLFSIVVLKVRDWMEGNREKDRGREER